MGNKTINICSMSGCHEATMHETGLCESCRDHVFETNTGTKRMRVKPSRGLNILWDLLPLGSSARTRMTSLGELSFRKLENITNVLGL